MQIARKFTEFSSGAVFLSLGLFHELFFVMGVEDRTDLFVLLLNMLEVLLTSIEVMLVFTGVEATETKKMTQKEHLLAL